MPNTPTEWGLALFPAAVIGTSAVYVAGASLLARWRRRRGIPAPGGPTFYERARAEARDREARRQRVEREAAQIVADQMDKVARFYDDLDFGPRPVDEWGEELLSNRAHRLHRL